MNKSKLIPLFLLTLLAFSACENIEVTEPTNTTENEIQDNTTEEMSESQEIITTSKYSEFNQEVYDNKLGKEPIALYFHADWCPTCKQLEERVLNNISSFPEETQILKTDFDTEKELRKKYNVTTQTTIIVLNANGEVVESLLNPSNAKLIATLERSFQ